MVFFLAEAKVANVKIQKSEIDLYTWVSFEDAQKMCKYDNDLRVLKKAENMINLCDSKIIKKTAEKNF